MAKRPAPTKLRPERRPKFTKDGGNAALSQPQNRFKFQTFAERIENISIDSFTRLTGFCNSRPGNESSWFLDALEAWRDLDYTADFGELLGDIGPMSVSLPSVLFHKERIVNALVDTISNGRCVRPTCSLIAMLVKDLGEIEGFPHFNAIFEAAAEALTKATDPDDIEAAFSCLLYVLKTMKMKVLADIETIYAKLFAPLFGKSKKAHLRRLGCFCYSYLIRQSANFEAIDALLQSAGSVDCTTESIVLSVIDPSSGKPRDKFKETITRCLEKSLVSGLKDTLIARVSERLSDLQLFAAVISTHHGTLSDDGLLRVVVACRTPEIFISGLEWRLSSNPLLACAVISRLNLEKTLSNRTILIRILDRMDHFVFSKSLAMLNDLEWPHLHLILSDTVSKRRLDEHLLLILACIKLRGVEVNWTKLGVDPEECYINDEKIFEHRLATLVLRLKRGLDLDRVHEHCTHPAVMYQATFADQVPFQHLLLCMSSSNPKVSQKAQTLLHARRPDSKLIQCIKKVDSIPANMEQYRNRIMALKELELALTADAEEIAGAVYYLLGSLHVKLTLLWPETFRVLSVIAGRHAEIFKESFARVFEYAVDEAREREYYNLPGRRVSRDLGAVHNSVSERLQSTDTLKSFLVGVLLQESKYSLLDGTAVGVFLKMISSYLSLAGACQPQLCKLLESISLRGGISGTALKTAQANIALILQSAALILKYSDGLRPFLQQYAMRYLANGDSKIQSSALSLVVALNKAQIQPEFAAELRALLDEKTGRDQLVTMSNEIGRWASHVHWLDCLLPVLIRLMYGKMISRRKSGAGRYNMEQRRRVILQTISGWPTDVKECFVEFITAPSMDRQHMSGFLGMLEPVLTCMGHSLSNTSHGTLLSSVLDILERTKDDKERKLHNMAEKRLILALEKVSSAVVTRDVLHSIWSLAIEPRLEKFEVELLQSKSTTVSLLVYLANSEYDELVNGKVMGKVTLAIGSEHVREPVLRDLLSICTSVITRERSSIIDVDSLIKAISSKAIRHASSKDIFLLGVRLMQGLAKDIRDPSDAKKLAVVTFGMLRTAKLPERQQSELVVLVSRLYHQARGICDADFIGDMVNCLSLQLSIMKGRASRQAIVDIFSQFDDLTPGWASRRMAEVIASLDSWSADVLDEPDYGKRIGAMSYLGQLDHYCILHWTPVLHTLLSYLQDPEEMALKSQATGLIERFILYDRSHDLANAIILPVVTKCVAHKHELVRFEFFGLLGKLTERYGNTTKYQCLVPLLANGEDESNVFACVSHLQVHRRARAIRRIVEFIGEKDFPDTTLLTDLVLRFLLKHCLYNTDGDGPAPDPLVCMEAAKTVGWLCGRFMDWPRYWSKLKRLVKQITSPSYPGAEKQAVKLLPELLKNLDVGRKKVDCLILRDRVLPLLFSAMKGNACSASPVTHISIAVAIAQLLVRLDHDTKSLHLPKLYSALSQTLKSRIEDERNDAREALVQVMKLFPEKAVDVLSGLRLVLARGYQRHVLAYTLHSILNSLATVESEELIQCSMDIIIDDTLGEVGAEKNTEEWSGKLKEARDCKSFGSLGLLVKKSAECKLLMAVLVRLSGCDAPDKDKYETIERLQTALLSNISDHDSKDLLVLSHELINSGSRFHHSGPEGTRPLFYNLGIKMTSSVVKKEERRNDELAPYLDVIVRNVIDQHWINSKDSQLTLSSIRLVCQLLVLYSELPALNGSALLVDLLQSAFELVVKSSAASHGDLIAAAFKYIALILRGHPDVEITGGQLKALLLYTGSNLERMEGQQLTFSLVRSMLSRRVHSAEMYQLMAQLRDLSITAGAQPTRQQCLSAFLTFYSNYEMADKRRLEHVTFFLDNLSYTGEGGRWSAIAGVEGCVAKLEMDEALGEKLSKALVLFLANEGPGELRSEVDRVAVGVLSKLSPRTVNKCIEAAIKWLNSPRLIVKRCAWIFLGLMLSTDHDNKSPLLESCVESLDSIDPTDHSDENAQLLSNVLNTLKRLQLNDYAKIKQLMLFPNLIIRGLADEVLLSADAEPDAQAAFKQIQELNDVHGSEVSDLALQLLLKSNASMCEEMERLIRKAGASQFTVHVGSAFKYYGGILAMNRVVPDSDYVVIVGACLRVTTSQSLIYPNSLKQLSMQVLEMVRASLGNKQYEEISSQVLSSRARTRHERKVQREQLAIVDPKRTSRAEIAGSGK